MDTTRRERRNFIKMMKKKNPNMSREELEKLKLEMRNLGIQKFIDQQKEIMERNSVKIVTSESEDVLDAELEDEDYAPEDL